MISTENFAIILAKKRKRITHVARETGISRTTLTAIYYNKSKGVSFDVLDKLCESLECEIGDIITYVVEER